MRTLRLGRQGPEVSAIGLGGRVLSESRGFGAEDEGIATIHAAAEAGVTLLETGDFYGMGHNEMLVREALWSVRREKLFIAVKFGIQRAPDGTWLGMDARPASIKSALAYSLRRLDTDYIDLYQPARIDPAVPIEETVGALGDLVRGGYIRHIALPDASPETIRRAHAIHPIAAVQAEYSLLRRDVEHRLLPTLNELGIALIAHGVLAGGWLGGGRAGALGPDVYSASSNTDAEQLARRRAVVATLEAIAEERDLTPARVAVAWILAQPGTIVPLLSAYGPEQLADALGALVITLSAGDRARLEQGLADGWIAAEQLPPAHPTQLDGSRPVIG